MPADILTTKPTDFIAGHAFVFANPETHAHGGAICRVRLSVVLLLVTVWFFARKLFGLPVAIVCGVLVAFDPTFWLMARWSRPMWPPALGILLAVYALYCYVLEPNRTRLLALGLAVGFALCLKHSTILLAVIVPVLLLGDLVFFDEVDLGRKLLRYAGALARGRRNLLTVLWACYGFRYAARPRCCHLDSATASPAHGTVATKSFRNCRVGISCRKHTWRDCRMCWWSRSWDVRRSCWASSIAAAIGFISQWPRRSSSPCPSLAGVGFGVRLGFWRTRLASCCSLLPAVLSFLRLQHEFEAEHWRSPSAPDASSSDHLRQRRRMEPCAESPLEQ